MNVKDFSEPALLTTSEAGRLLGVSPKTVTRLARDGHLAAVRFGPYGRWRIVRAEVGRLVAKLPASARKDS